MKTRYALAIFAAALISTAAIDAKAQDAKTTSFVATGLQKALARQSKANDQVIMWQKCMQDATPCIEDAKTKADKSAKRAQKKLDDLNKLAAK